MLISQYANLLENKYGFWVEKLYSESGKCSYLVFYQGITEFCDSISEAKQKLIDRCKTKSINVTVTCSNSDPTEIALRIQRELARSVALSI
jgi:hypothetical protein